MAPRFRLQTKQNEADVQSIRCVSTSASCCGTRNSRQITYSVSNVLRWQRRLDFTIAHLTGKPCTKLEPRVHAILRLAVHELLFQKLPAHAVSEHVTLAKSLVRPAAGSLVNGEPTQCKK